MLDSQEAYELFRAQPEKFDLIITDHKMPNMTGAELAAKILQIRPGMPIIMCTGYSEDITKEPAKALGVREFFLNPISRQEIIRAISKVIDS